MVLVSDPTVAEEEEGKREKGVSFWMEEISRKAPGNVTTIITSSKSDLVAECKDPVQSDFYEKNVLKLEEIAIKNNCKHILTSSKTPHNVDELFSTLTKEMMKKVGFYSPERVWMADDYSRGEWGGKFNEIAATLLLIKKRHNESGVLRDVPKPLLFLIMTLLSEQVLKSGEFSFLWEEVTKKVEEAPKKSQDGGYYSTFCTLF